jgi:hypothetical protein
MECTDSDWEDEDSDDAKKKKGRVYTLDEDKPAKKLVYELPGSATKEQKPKVPHRFKGNKDQILAQIAEAIKYYRPQGRVTAIIESPNRSKEQMCTLTTLNVKE